MRFCSVTPIRTYGKYNFATYIHNNVPLSNMLIPYFDIYKALYIGKNLYTGTQDDKAPDQLPSSYRFSISKNPLRGVLFSSTLAGAKLRVFFGINTILCKKNTQNILFGIIPNNYNNGWIVYFLHLFLQRL